MASLAPAASLCAYLNNCESLPTSSLTATPTDNRALTFELVKPNNLFRGAPNARWQSRNHLSDSLRTQVARITAASASQNNFSLSQVANHENQFLDGLAKADEQRDFTWKASHQSTASLFAEIDQDIDGLRMGIPSFNPPVSAQGRIAIASVTATTFRAINQVIGFAFEEAAKGVQTVCSSKYTQPGCDKVAEGAVDLVQGTIELWRGSSAESAFQSVSEAISEPFQQYVRDSDMALSKEGFSPEKIKQYNEDLETVAFGVGTLGLGYVGGNLACAAGKLITKVKIGMQATKVVRAPAMTMTRQSVLQFQHIVDSTYDPATNKSILLKMHMKNKKHMIIGEKLHLESSTLAPKPFKPPKNFTKNNGEFYSQCAEHFISATKIGPKSGRLKHTLLSHIADDHMLFFIRKHPPTRILKERGIIPIYESVHLTSEERMEYILQVAYGIAQQTGGVKRLSFAWDSNDYAVVSTLLKQKHKIKRRGSFAVGDKSIELVEIKFRGLFDY